MFWQHRHLTLSHVVFHAVGYKLLQLLMVKASQYQKLWPLGVSQMAKAVCLKPFWASGSTYGETPAASAWRAASARHHLHNLNGITLMQ